MALSKEEKIKRLKVQIKQLSATKQKEERRLRARQLISIGAEFARVSSISIMLEFIQNKGALYQFSQNTTIQAIKLKQQLEAGTKPTQQQP